MTSRLTSDALIPSVPIVSPSLMAMVLNSIGVPPAARTPSFTFSASWRKCELHGMVSIQVLAMPTMGFGQIVVGKADGPEIRARRGPRRAVDNDAAVFPETRIHDSSEISKCE